MDGNWDGKTEGKMDGKMDGKLNEMGEMEPQNNRKMLDILALKGAKMFFFRK